MAELGSTGGNLDNILQYLLQRIEKSGIAEGGTGGVARFADLSDVPAPTSGKTQYWGWTGSAYAWLNAPEGGGGSNVDPSDYYTKTQVNNLLADYAKTIDLPDMTKYVLLETYNKGIGEVAAWATSEANTAAAAAQGNAIAAAKSYTDGKASATLSAANANAATIIEQALEGYVTLNTEQEITAAKKFVSMYDFFGTKSDGIYFYNHDSNGVLIGHYGSNYYGDDSYLQFRNGDWKGYVQFMKGIVGNVNVKNGGIEIFDTKPYIDFHYGNSTADFTSRIIESASGVLELFSSSYNPGTLKIGNAYITYDSKNNALMVSDGSGGAVNIVAMGDVAAFGGLGSGFDTLTDLTLTNKLTAKSASITEALTAGGINVTGAKEGYINLARGNIEDCYQITGDEIYAKDFFYLGSNKISQISASGNETSGYVVKITIDGKTYAMDAIMLT